MLIQVLCKNVFDLTFDEAHILKGLKYIYQIKNNFFLVRVVGST